MATMQNQIQGMLDLEEVIIRLQNHRIHYLDSMAHLMESSQTYSHCQKECNAITELLNNPDVLKIYVDTWNESVGNLYKVKSAVNEYGVSVSGLFNLESITHNCPRGLEVFEGTEKNEESKD